VKYFRVKNFEKYQPNRKEKSAPWIRLYASWNNDWAIGQLADSHKAHFTGLLLMAHATNNQIPWDSKWIKSQIQAKSNVKIEVFEKLGLIESLETNKKTDKKNTTPENSRVENRIDEVVTGSSLINFYHDEFFKIYKIKPVINGGKDGSILKGLEKLHGADKVKGLITQFLLSRDEWVAGTDRSIGVFKSQVQKLLVGKLKDPHNRKSCEAVI
jgi:hypothetical protein